MKVTACTTIRSDPGVVVSAVGVVHVPAVSAVRGVRRPDMSKGPWSSFSYT